MSVQVKLDICRRFVFSDMPAFFLRIVINKDEEPIDARIVHVDEGLGAEVLEVLRGLEGPDPASTLHQRKFTVRWSASQRVAPNGHAVLERLMGLIGDPATYAERKRGWRESVGYESRPTKLRVRATSEAMARHLLGESDSFQAEITHASTSRFGLSRDLAKIVGIDRTLSMGISEGDESVFRIKRGSDWIDVPGRFWSPLRAFPGKMEIPDNVLRWRFEGGLFDLRAKEETVALCADTAQGRTATLGAWRASGQACRLLLQGKCQLGLLLHGTTLSLGEVEVDWSAAGVPGLDQVEIAARFAAEVGIGESLVLSVDDLFSGHEERVDCLELHAEENPVVDIGLDGEWLRTLPAGVPMIVTGAHWGYLADRFAVCVATTKQVVPTSSSTPGGGKVVRLATTIAERTRWELAVGPDAALEKLRSLAANAENHVVTEGVAHLLLHEPAGLIRLARPFEPEGTPG